MTPWKMEPLRDLGRWYGGGTPSKSRPEFWTGGTIPWLSPKDMGPDVLSDTQDKITVAAAENSTARLVPVNSVAMVVRSGILERRLPVALIPFETTLNQDMKAIFPRADISPKWIAWWLRSAERELLATTRKAGTTVASIETSRLMDANVPIPPLSEQRRIVEILEDHLSRLDAAQLSMGLADQRLKVLEAAHLETQAKLASRTLSLREIALRSGYGTSAKCVVNGPGVAVARIPNLVDGQVDLADEKRLADPGTDISSLMLIKGDLLIIRTNGSRNLIGRSAVVQDKVNASFASYLIRYQLDHSQVRPEWAHIMLERPTARQELEALAASTAGQYNLSLGKLHTVAIPVPSIDVQDRALRETQNVLSAISRLQREISAANNRATSLRSAILSAAFSGQLTGSASDMERVEEMAGE